MHRLATMHSVTDRRLYGQTDSIMPIAIHITWQYDQQKTVFK